MAWFFLGMATTLTFFLLYLLCWSYPFLLDPLDRTIAGSARDYTTNLELQAFARAR